jgi:hypothetical protein
VKFPINQSTRDELESYITDLLAEWALLRKAIEEAEEARDTGPGEMRRSIEEAPPRLQEKH